PIQAQTISIPMSDALSDLDFFPPDLLGHCLHIARRVNEAGGRALLVGRCLGDTILQHAPKDVDIEVHRLPAERLQPLLAEDYRVDLVGKAFGVLKLKGVEIDVSLPRRESKTGTGHKAFHIESDPHMRPFDAAERRDFTINAIAWDPLSGELIDPFNGQSDL